MNESASKRLRLRFFPEDDRAVEDALALTTHSSKSNVIRAALSLYESVWASAREGFSVVYRRDGAAECPEVLASIEPAAKPGKGSRAHTETSIEIRITPADHERIEGLLVLEAADTASEVVRRAVRLYAAVAARRKEGWDVIAVSPSGDALHVAVPGMGISAREALPLQPAQRPAPIMGGQAAQPRSLNDLLPRSLAGMVADLAEKEQCPPDVLLVDIIRYETTARLHGLKKNGPAGTPPGSSGWCPPVAPEIAAPSASPGSSGWCPPVAPEAPTPVAPQQNEQDERCVETIAATFDQIDQQVDNIMRLFGEAARSDGQQELTDLLFAAGLVDNGTAAAIAEDTAATFAPNAVPAATPGLARLAMRSREINERLTALASIAALAPRKDKSKTRSRKSNAATPDPADTPGWSAFDRENVSPLTNDGAPPNPPTSVL